MKRMKQKLSKSSTDTKKNDMVVLNKKARFDYHIEDQFEAGMVLEGWEVKSIRAGRAQIKESYVILKRGEAWLIGASITPLQTASTTFTLTLLEVANFYHTLKNYPN